jgi:hypothetical protein
LPADNLAILVPKSMTFSHAAADAFKTVPEDPNIQTFVLKNATPDKPVDFTISGTGSIPREQQGTPGAQSQGASMGAGGQDAAGSADASAPNGARPGGGIGNPIDTPDPLSKYKWWILGGLGLLFAAAAAFLLRKPQTDTAAVANAAPGTSAHPATYPAVGFASPAAKHTQLLNALKEELFTLESEKINGAIEPEEYAHAKAALESVLKRALNRK